MFYGSLSWNSRCRRRLQPARPSDRSAQGRAPAHGSLRLSAHAPAKAGAYSALMIILLGVQILIGANKSPIADAAEQKNVALVRTLIQQHSDVNAAQGDGMTALHWAAMNDDAALAKMLIDAKADLNAVTRLGAYTPLYLAAKNGSA